MPGVAIRSPVSDTQTCDSLRICLLGQKKAYPAVADITGSAGTRADRQYVVNSVCYVMLLNS